MPDVKRITPEEAVEAYAKTGFELIRGDYFSYDFFGDGRRDGGCGIGTYAVAFLGYDAVTSDKVNVNRAMREAGFTSDYRRGFACGFDGDRLPENWKMDDDALIGYADGKDAWAAVWAARKAKREADRD